MMVFSIFSIGGANKELPMYIQYRSPQKYHYYFFLQLKKRHKYLFILLKVKFHANSMLTAFNFFVPEPFLGLLSFRLFR